MRAALLALTLLLQVPDPIPVIRVSPAPPESTPAARASMLGLRIIEVRPDGTYFMGSACPISPFAAYTALHVVADPKGQLIAIPTHGFHPDDKTFSHVHVAWKDEKHDLALIVPDDAEQNFLYWYTVGPVPVMGAPVSGTLILPSIGNPAVTSFGSYYSEGDGWHWTSLVSGPGSSGSCALDDQGRAWGVTSQTASWGNEGVSPANMPRATLIVAFPKK